MNSFYGFRQTRVTTPVAEVKEFIEEVSRSKTITNVVVLAPEAGDRGVRRPKE